MWRSSDVAGPFSASRFRCTSFEAWNARSSSLATHGCSARIESLITMIPWIIVIKDSILAEHPWVAKELLRAFQASKEVHLKRLAENGPATSDDRHILENQELIGGGDPLPFGLEA